ncbi:MAG: RIP metalloprotease RseP [Armatimonadetes bacterium]|nr:RIP metalloprotease RseP [Armatimonadota bacterium]
MTFIINTLYTIIPFLLILGVLVFVHELGHYWAARRAGMKVHEFAIGFGNVLWSTKRKVPVRVGRSDEMELDETTYSLRAIPLGGFVRIAGMDPGEDPNEPGSFSTKSWGWRFTTLIAGCVMNFALAVLLYGLIGSFHGIPTDRVTSEIGGVVPGTPAAKAGLKAGDKIVAVNDIKTEEVSRLRSEIESHPGRPVQVVIRRGEETLTRTLTPTAAKDEAGQTVGRVGVAFSPVFERVGPIQALGYGVTSIWTMTRMTFEGLGAMITRRIGFKDNIGGPVMILQQTGEVAQRGVMPLLHWMAMLSVNLGIFNLLPIPALDGGRLMFLLIEAVRFGRRVDPKKEAYVHMAGFVLLLLFILTVTYNDLSRALSNWF